MVPIILLEIKFLALGSVGELGCVGAAAASSNRNGIATTEILSRSRYWRRQGQLQGIRQMQVASLFLSKSCRRSSLVYDER